MPGHGHDMLTGFPGRLRQFFPIEAQISMGARVEGTFAWVGGPFGQILAEPAPPRSWPSGTP